MTLLKQDLFGTVRIENRLVIRETRSARRWLRGLARHMARREARALARLANIEGVPGLIQFRDGVLSREWIDGAPMHRARPTDRAYFRQALHLLRRMHARGVVHNDLAKEPNWLVTSRGAPALVDFQLALCTRRKRRGRIFRALAHDDLRHLLKHKRTYASEHLTARQLRILATPSLIARIWMGTGKPVYLLITRRLLKWADREGAGDRVNTG